MSQPQGIDISTLTAQQLSALQSRLSQELEHLSSSYQRLRSAQARFKDCIRSIADGVVGRSGETPLLIPLTTSLYIPGTLSSTSPTSPNTSKSPQSTTLLVDIGTGFLVEKTPQQAQKFYTGKIEELAKNLSDIEKVVGGKSENLRIVEEVLRRRLVEEQSQGGQGSGGGGGEEGKAGG